MKRDGSAGGCQIPVRIRDETVGGTMDRLCSFRPAATEHRGREIFLQQLCAAPGG